MSGIESTGSAKVYLDSKYVGETDEFSPFPIYGESPLKDIWNNAFEKAIQQLRDDIHKSLAVPSYLLQPEKPMTAEQMATERQFIADICANPRDVGVRLIYADWLEERGNVYDADLIRMDKHERSVIDTISNDCIPDSAWWLDKYFPWTTQHKTSHGFIEQIWCSLADWLKHHAEIRACQPITAVWPTGYVWYSPCVIEYQDDGHYVLFRQHRDLGRLKVDPDYLKHPLEECVKYLWQHVWPDVDLHFEGECQVRHLPASPSLSPNEDKQP